jgi:hypothetical protein
MTGDRGGPQPPGLREVRLIVPDARSLAVRRRIAEQVARLDPDDEEAALEWIEVVSELGLGGPSSSVQ